MQVAPGVSNHNLRGKIGLVEKNESPRHRRPELVKHNSSVLPQNFPTTAATLVDIGSPTKQQQTLDHHHSDDGMSKGSSCGAGNTNVASLKRTRSATAAVHRSTAKSDQTHRLASMQVVICSDDSPCGHFVHGRLRIVVGIEDEQTAPPRRKPSFTTTTTRRRRPLPAIKIQAMMKNADTTNNKKKHDEPGVVAEEREGDDDNNKNNNLSPPRPDVALLTPPYKAESMVHESGICRPERSNDGWDQSVWSSQQTNGGVQPGGCLLVEEAAEEQSVEVVSPVTVDEWSRESSSFLYFGGHESEISIDPLNDFSPRKSTRAKAAAAARRAALTSLYEEAAVVAVDETKDPLAMTPFTDSVRHKSFQSLQESKCSSRLQQSQHSRYNAEDSVVVAVPALRKSRRDVIDSNRKPSVRSKVNNSNNRRLQQKSPPPPESSKVGTNDAGATTPPLRRLNTNNNRRSHQSPTPPDSSEVGADDAVATTPPSRRLNTNNNRRSHQSPIPPDSEVGANDAGATTPPSRRLNTNNNRPSHHSPIPPDCECGANDVTATTPPLRRLNINNNVMMMSEYLDSIQIETIMEDVRTTKNERATLPSHDSSTTLNNKSSDQEFAQLDLGDQQGIRMVNRTEVLSEQLPGLHERKALVKRSPPRTSASSQGFGGLLRSKMASFRSASSRMLLSDTSNLYVGTGSNHHGTAIMMPPPQQPQYAPPTIGLVRYRSHSSRCLSKQQNATLLDDDASSVEF